MQRKISIFTFLLMALTTMPFSAFSDFGNSFSLDFDSFKAQKIAEANNFKEEKEKEACPDTVSFEASELWKGISSNEGNKYKQATRADKESLNKYKTKFQNILKQSETNNITNSKCTGDKCIVSCNSISETCHKGELIRDCAPSIYQCWQNIYVSTEYSIYMIKKVCPETEHKDSRLEMLSSYKNTLVSKSLESSAATAQENGISPEANTSSTKSSATPSQHEQIEPLKADTTAPTKVSAESVTKDLGKKNTASASKPSASKAGGAMKPKKVPAPTLSKTDKKEDEKAKICTQKGGSYDGVSICWCDGENIIKSDKTCAEIKAEKAKQKETKQHEKEEKKKQKEQDDTLKAEAQAKDKTHCENVIGGTYSLNNCWCGTTKVLDQSKTCEQIQAEKDKAKADKKAKRDEDKAALAEAKARDKEKCENTIGGKYSLDACWCGTTKVLDQSKTCDEIKQEKERSKVKIIDDAKTEDECDATGKGQWNPVEGVCEQLSSSDIKDAECVAKGGNYKAGSCWCDGIIMTKNSASCTDKKAAKANSKLEKDFLSDIKSLSKAFSSAMKNIINTCENSGGTYSDGDCVVTQQPTEKNNTNNQRTSSKGRSKRNS